MQFKEKVILESLARDIKMNAMITTGLCIGRGKKLTTFIILNLLKKTGDSYDHGIF
jgi:hypothetical protein